MSKKRCALVFGITNNYMFALANTLIGLKKNNSVFWDDIIVYIDQISEQQKDSINKILKVKFVKINSDSYNNLNTKAIQKYSVAAFYRYECFKLLDDYETVIWNDVDILIKGDISGLQNYGNESGFAATRTMGNFNIEANFKKLILKYNMFDKLYNSGLLVLKDNLKDYKKMFNWCIQKTNEYLEILNWPDQGIINLLIQEFNINVDLIDIDKYCCHPSQLDKLKQASIVHAYGDEKFWNNSKLRNMFPSWQENELEWQSISVSNNEESKPLVSCVMSTYERYDYLQESVDSILNQTYRNFELIVVLEYCKNQTIIEKMLKKLNDSRIKIIKNTERVGFAESLNIGIKAAKGKYIARMDDDDISHPTRFERQVEFLENHKDVGICGTSGDFFGKYQGNIPVKTDPETLKVTTLFKTPFIHPTVMMRKDMIKHYNLYYDKNYFTEDYELWSRAVNCFKISNIDCSLLDYRCSDTNSTAGQNEIKIHDSHKAIMKNQLKKYLNLDLTNNEIETIQLRKDIITNSANQKEIICLRKEVLKKIINANNITNYYDKKVLEKILQEEFAYNNINIKRVLKHIIKKIISPFYSRLMFRIDEKIAHSEQKMKAYCDSCINESQDKKGK